MKLAKRGGTKCRECNHIIPPNLSRCPSCGTWNVKTSTFASTIDEHTVLMSDASLSVVQRIHTGLVDAVFGGGICCTSVNLLAGDPGAGKTTLCLQLCDIVLEQTEGREVLYIANEQDPAELRETGRRLELKHTDRIRVVRGMGGLNFDLGEMLLRVNPCLIILDSVTKWSGDDPALAVVLCQNLKDYCVRIGSPALVINQVTKDGDHAGLNAMQHAVDMCAMFELEFISDKGTDSVRKLWTKKNRFGPAPEEQFFHMGERGLEPLIEEPESEENDEIE